MWTLIVIPYLVMIGVILSIVRHWWNVEKDHPGPVFVAIFWPCAFIVVAAKQFTDKILNRPKPEKPKKPQVSVELCPECHKRIKKGPHR